MISLFDKEEACAITHPTLTIAVNTVTINVTDDTNFTSLEEFLAACSLDDLQNATLESAANYQERLKQS